MLTEIFKGILSASLSTAPIILIIAAISPLLKKRYAPDLRHIVWLIVAVRLCLPVSMPAAPAIVIPAGEPIVYLSDDAGAVAQAFAELEQGGERETAATAGRFLSPLGLLAMVWLAGAGLLMTVQAAAYLHARRKLARWSRAADDETTLALLSRYKKEIGTSSAVAVYRCETLAAPLLIGLLRPAILLPSTELSPAQTRYVLLHELSHLRRHDLWFKLLLAAVSSLHWFNPLVWLMAKRAESDMEISCDAAVLRLSDGVSRRDYGLAILSFIDAQGQRRLPLTTGFFGGGRQTVRRFEGIMDSGIKKRGAVIVALAVAAVATSALLVGCGISEPAPPAAVPETQISALVADPAAPEKSAAEPQTDDPKRAAFEEDIRRVHEKGDGTDAIMRWPLPGDYTIIEGYGSRYGDADLHAGIDIGGDDASGKPVVAASDGEVTYVNETETPDVGYGLYVVVDHGGGLHTIYAHLSEMYVTVGQIVEEGQGIGAVGDTGYAPEPHLHFEVREDGEAADPKKFLLSEQDQQP